MLKAETRKIRRLGRSRRVRAKLTGTALRPRLSVFRSLRYISAQAIDDVSGRTMAQAHLAEFEKKTHHNVAGAALVGQAIAERLMKLGVTEVIFDRSGYMYHGKVKALAEAARVQGLKF